MFVTEIGNWKMSVEILENMGGSCSRKLQKWPIENVIHDNAVIKANFTNRVGNS